MPTQAATAQVFTDQIVTLGVVRRVYFRVLIYDDPHINYRWAYFGTTEAEQPPPDSHPVVEYPYVTFPVDFDDLGEEMIPTLFDLALQAGKAREGWAGDGGNVWTDEYQDTGVARVLRFHAWNGSRQEWYYYGVDPLDYPPEPQYEGPINEVAEIQFPRDFAELGEEANRAIYDLAMRAGLKREGLAE